MLIIHGSQREIKSNKTIRVKGHTLDDRTMSIAVPTINLAIYVNPIFAIFTKLSIAVLSINSDNLSQGKNNILFNLNFVNFEYFYAIIC